MSGLKLGLDMSALPPDVQTVSRTSAKCHEPGMPQGALHNVRGRWRLYRNEATPELRS